MPVNVIGTLKPKNNGKFPVAEAVDIKVTEELRLDEALTNKADLDTLNFALSIKADKTTTTSLQNQINEIITPVTQDAEVQNARVDGDGVTYNTLKQRIDTNISDLSSDNTQNKKDIFAIGGYLNDRIPAINLADEGEVLKGVEFKNNSSPNITGEIVPSTNPDSTIIIVKVKPSAKYWISQLSFAYYNICLYDEDMEFISTLWAHESSPAWNAVHTMPNNCHYFAFMKGSSYTAAVVPEEYLSLYNSGAKYLLDSDVTITESSLSFITDEITQINNHLNSLNEGIEERMPAINIVEYGEVRTGVTFKNASSANITGEIIASSDPDSTIIICKVTPGGKYWINQITQVYYNICLYDSTMTFISSMWALEPSIAWDAVHTLPNNCAYLAFLKGRSNEPAIVAEKNVPFYNDNKKYVIGNEVAIPKESAALNMFLPPDIYIAEGRTIELYNSQVLINAYKYNIQWQCSIGNAYQRKFSITAIAAMVGNTYPLTFNVYDDELNLVGTASSTVHVVADSLTSGTKIVTIGDSLSYSDKRQFPEIRLLSNDNIEFVGTKAYTTKASDDSTHAGYTDGRPGFTSSSFVSGQGSSYYDNEDHNSFWDGSKFNFSYYVTNTLSGSAPSGVFIWLGTNEINNVTNYINNVTEMISSIREYSASLPIYIVNTVYRANQDAIGQQGNVEGYNPANGAFKYRDDKRVLTFMQEAYEEFNNMTNVYCVPLAVLHDSEYNYGQKEENVNPRNTRKFIVPVDSIHPLSSGQYQMADVFYSWLCGTM